MQNKLALGFVLLFLTSPLRADQKLQSDLDSFRRDPASFMNAVPRKDGAAVVKQKITSLGVRTLAEFQDGDHAEDLVEPKYQSGQLIPLLSGLQEIESAGLMTSALASRPWSDTYWPTYQGGIAARYAAVGFPATSKDWKVHQAFSQQTVDVDLLSPAEKYDLLVGDNNKTLSAAMWSEGNFYYTHYGQVDDWIGVCDGWSLASTTVARPKHQVVIGGLTFYPADIKALVDRLNAKGRRQFRMVGAKCHPKPLASDVRTEARARSGEHCLGTNPGTWHQVVINQLGARQLGLVMDASNDDQVWNQPIYSYRYQYFNPLTLKTVATLPEATVTLRDFATDKFKAFRSPNAVAVVGIGMDLTYMDESQPRHLTTDSEANDVLTSVHYLYDVELDAQNQIVGGEWYQDRHPDFLWAGVSSSHVTTSVDDDLEGDWDGTGTMPSAWQPAAIEASSYGLPLSHIVDLLVALSQK